MKRYDLMRSGGIAASMFAIDGGEWVKYEDAEAALAEEKRRAEKAEELLALHHPEEMTISDPPGAFAVLYHQPPCSVCKRYEKALSTARRSP